MSGIFIGNFKGMPQRFAVFSYFYAPVAELEYAPGLEPGVCGFDSHQGYFVRMVEWHTQQAQTLFSPGSNPGPDTPS